jgi:catechol 2,3-dioxygenase-like lactoylglutathione lyase family enzyme
MCTNVGQATVENVGDGSCSTHSKWTDAVDLRWHHVSFVVEDVCASAHFYQEIFGFGVMQSTLIPMGPCQIKSIVLTGGGGNLLDLNQFICPPGIQGPPMGFIHYVYHVNDVQVFANRVAAHDVPISINITSVDMNGLHIQLVCFLDPDGIEFCGARQWGKLTQNAF